MVETTGYQAELAGGLRRRPRAHPAKSRALQRTAERRAHGLQQAEQWLREGLHAAGLTAADLPGLKSTDPRKTALAGLMWRHTTVSQTWLAEKLHLKSAANVSQVLRRTLPEVERHPRLLPPALRAFLKTAAAESEG